MPKPVYFIVIVSLLVLWSCNSDEPDLGALFEGKSFDVRITSPDNGQGFSTKEAIEFNAIVRFPNRNDTGLSKYLEITFSSDKDGLLAGELMNQDGEIIFRPVSLSSNEHTITMKAIDPNQIEKSSSIKINTLAPGTIKLSVSKDSKENAIINWSVTSPELIDRIELYRTQYIFVSGGNAYSPEPLDTIRFYPGNSHSFYDNTLPFTDKVVYAIRAFTKQGHWSKNKRDTTIAGTKRFRLNVSDKHDWNAYGADALSPGSEKIIHIRNGSMVTAFDFEKMSVIRNLELNFPINYFHIGDHGSGPELYIANNQTLLVYNSLSYDKKTEISFNYKIEGIQGHNNLLFLSMTNHFNRTTLFKTNNSTPAYRFKLLEDGSSLIAISYSLTPTDMKYADFKNDLNNPQIFNDKYHSTHPLSPGLFQVIPGQNQVITSGNGAVYTADKDMNFMGSLFDVKSEVFSCFGFNDSGTIAYAGLRYKKSISIYSFPQMTKLGEIKTKGYPAFIFFKGTNLVSVSSTRAFDWLDGLSEIGFEIFDL